MTPFEAVIASKLIEQGYDVLASGWPDFCAVKTTGDVTEVRFIEVKGRGDTLKPNQKKLHKILNILGLEVEVIQEDANHRMQYPPALATGVRVVRRHLGGRPPAARQKAIEFLHKTLPFSLSVSNMVKLATEEGISRSTLYRTMVDMRLKKIIVGREARWVNRPEEKKS